MSVHASVAEAIRRYAAVQAAGSHTQQVTKSPSGETHSLPVCVQGDGGRTPLLSVCKYDSLEDLDTMTDEELQSQVSEAP